MRVINSTSKTYLLHNNPMFLCHQHKMNAFCGTLEIT